MKPRTLTKDDLAATEIEFTMHMNLGGGSYGYGYRSKEFPRIGFLELSYKGALAKKMGKTSERIWTLDGARMESMEAAFAGHANAPAITEEEQRVLDLVPADWRPYRELARSIDAALGLTAREEGRAAACYTHLAALRDKGILETKQEPCEPTEFTAALKLDHLNTITMMRRAPADAE